MRKRKLLILLSLSLGLSLAGPALGQTVNPDEVRRTFLGTRQQPQVSGVLFKKRTGRGGSTSAGGGVASGTAGGFGGSRGISSRVGAVMSRPPKSAPPASAGDAPPTPEPVAAPAAEVPAPGLGLGYTLFQKAPDGSIVRSEPSHGFGPDEKVRLWLEPSTDGYLYVFTASATGPPFLLYPAPNINAGRNLVYAHIPLEWPLANDGVAEESRWLQFPAKAGAATFYVVLAKEPLAGLPVGKKLADYCAQHKDAAGQCQLEKKLWADIAAFDQPGQVQSAETANATRQKQMPVELAVTLMARGYGLTPEDPTPSVIFMNADAARSVFFTKLEILHK